MAVVERKGGGHPRSRSRAYQMAIAAKSRPNARVRRAVSRCFIVSNGQPILTREVLSRAFPKQQRFSSWHYWSAYRALRGVAVVVGRHRFGRGRPNLWKPNEHIGGDKPE